ncbi:MAG: hypothetical protein K6G90_12560 [Clostridia bacterium]|nr:hypothetical protein [Clostridia bacterium]
MKIIYKIVNALLALCVAPVLLFLPMFRLVLTVGMNSNSKLGILGGILGNALDINKIIANVTGVDLEHMPEFYTLRQAYDTLFGSEAKLATGDVDINALPEGLIPAFRNMLITLACIVIIALAITIIGIFTKKIAANIALSGVGFIGVFAMNRFFMNAAGPLVSGKMSVNSILAAVKSLEQYKSTLEYIDIDIRIFELSGAYKMLFIVFGVLILFNIIFHFIQQSENNKTPKERKRAEKAKAAAKAAKAAKKKKA